jgi:MSHA pilin protein MshD
MCSAIRHPLPRPLLRAARGRGVTLIEVLIFILIVSVALAAILNLLTLTVAHSGDPLVRRQSLAVGESLIQEIDSVPFAQNDPRTGAAEAIGPESGESRGSNTAPFDDPRDYSGYSETGITTPDGTPIPGLSSYSATASAAQQSVGNIPAADGLLVTVTVTGPSGEPMALSSFRALYAP